ncbi:MAG: antiterminator LoaP [Spirochaetes bacterium]|nr:antiterminator LoaP [Spirochaetota bacterium]MBU1081391.1 antiterminator LoaP [Spirochaetota bacterium]
MDYFAIQVWTGKEDEFAEKISANPRVRSKPMVPKRTIPVRRRGKTHHEERPLFPGYVFLSTDEEELDASQRWLLRSTRYFVRALPSTAKPLPVKEKDRRLLAHFMSFGKVADISKVRFDADDRIVVVEGPLKGLEGMIVKVDARKRRAKIRLDMCENSFLVDMGFEILDRPAKGPASDDGQTSRES